MKPNGWQRLVESFSWEVAAHGYTWCRGEIPSEDRTRVERDWYLTTLDPMPLHVAPFDWLRSQAEPRSYKPLLHFSGLFQILSKTDPSKEGVLDFANKFGTLSGFHFGPVHNFGPPKTDWDAPADTVTLYRGEPLSAWKDEIKAFQHAIALWEAMRDSDESKVPPGSGARGLALGRSKDFKTDWPSWDDGSGLMGHLMLAGDLSQTINDRLRRHEAGFVFRARSKLPGIEAAMNAPTLVGAIWLQFASAVAGAKTFSTCARCGAPFEVPPKVQGRKLYCSSACRMAAHRERHGGRP